jgi:hypothetical protein
VSHSTTFKQVCGKNNENFPSVFVLVPTYIYNFEIGVIRHPKLGMVLSKDLHR